MNKLRFHVLVVSLALTVCTAGLFANPISGQKDFAIELDESGTTVVGSVLSLQEQYVEDFRLQRRDGESWKTIGSDWAKGETVMAESGSGEMEYTRYEIEGACPSEGQHVFRLAFIDKDDGDVYEMQTETLECTGAGLASSDVECSVSNPGSVPKSWFKLLFHLVLP